MSLDARLKRVSPALTARERGLLVLGSLKEGTPEDPSWRNTIPPHQVDEFNQLIDLMNGTNIQLASYITILERLVAELELRQAWLVTLLLWDDQLHEIRRAVQLAVREPITESDYGARLKAVADAWVPVDELAAVLAGAHDDWAAADYEAAEEGEAREISDGAWERVCRQKEKELRSLVAAGKLPRRGRGRTLCIQEGAFNARFGRKTVTVPDDLLSFRVLPDGQALAVQAEQYGLARLFTALEWRPLVAKDAPEDGPMLALVAAGLQKGLASGLADCSQAVATVDAVVTDVMAEFGGADPLKPPVRERLERTRGKLRHLEQELADLGVELESPEPDEELQALVYDLVR